MEVVIAFGLVLVALIIWGMGEKKPEKDIVQKACGETPGTLIKAPDGKWYDIYQKCYYLYSDGTWEIKPR